MELIEKYEEGIHDLEFFSADFKNGSMMISHIPGNFPLGVDAATLSVWIASLRRHPRGRHLYRRPLGWRLQQGYHTDHPA